MFNCAHLTLAFFLGLLTADRLIPAGIVVVVGCIATMAGAAKVLASSPPSPDGKALGTHIMMYGILWMGYGSFLVFAGY